MRRIESTSQMKAVRFEACMAVANCSCVDKRWLHACRRLSERRSASEVTKEFDDTPRLVSREGLPFSPGKIEISAYQRSAFLLQRVPTASVTFPGGTVPTVVICVK
jgi:hypothetical protein